MNTALRVQIILENVDVLFEYLYIYISIYLYIYISIYLYIYISIYLYIYIYIYISCQYNTNANFCPPPLQYEREECKSSLIYINRVHYVTIKCERPEMMHLDASRRLIRL